MADFAGKFVWYELAAPNVEAAQKFYNQVVGWQAQAVPELSYTILLANEARVAGLMAPPNPTSKGWLGYIGVSDVDDMAQRVARAGGSVCHGPADIPNVGRFAVAADPQGAVFALFQPLDSEQDRPPVAQGTPGHVGWHELGTSDQQAAFDFYAGLFGWTKDHAMDMGEHGTYQIFAIAGVPSGGMFSMSGRDAPCSWLFYFNVPAIQPAMERVKQAGGSVLQGPMQVPGGSWIIHCRDDQDLAFALVGSEK